MIWAYLILSCLGTVAAGYALYVWGWSDVSVGDRRVYRGEPDDEWHVRRRRAAYIALSFAAGLNPVGLVILAVWGRKLFRRGVMDADPETYARWYS